MAYEGQLKPDSMPEGANLRPVWADSWLKRADLWLKRIRLRPEMAVLKLERAELRHGRADLRSNKRVGLVLAEEGRGA